MSFAGRRLRPVPVELADPGLPSAPLAQGPAPDPEDVVVYLI